MSDTAPTSGRYRPGPVDLHQHVISQSYVSRLSSIGVQAQPGIPFPDWDRDTALKALDRLGVAVAAVSVASPGFYFGDQRFTTELVGEVNDELAGLVAGSEHRLLAFAAVPLPDVDAAVAEVRRWADHPGFAGVSLLSNYGGSYLGHPAMEPLLTELNDLRAIVHVHPTLPAWWAEGELDLRPSLLEYVFDTSRSLTNLMLHDVFTRYNAIDWVFSHCGGVLPFLTRRLEIAEPLPELSRVGSVRDTLASLHYDCALSSGDAGLGAALSVIDEDHIMLGTDYPFVDESVIADEFGRLDKMDAIGGVPTLGRNARELLGLDRRSAITVRR